MRHRFLSFTLAGLAGLLPGLGLADEPASVQMGPRPFFLVEDMKPGALKSELQACAAKRDRWRSSDFSIGHRGAPLQFPEHTKESYEAAARMGAGIVECDVTFTKDKELVCRHAQNDLHTTTNILATPLASKCVKPFTPAVFDAAGTLVRPASAECRTSEVTLAEFKTLRGKMDAFNPRARTVAEYMAGTANWRTDLYSGPTSGTLLTHRESIELFKKLGVKMTPELKNASVTMPFDGFSQEAYAQKMIDEYKQAGVPPRRVWPQSFSKDDVLYWVRSEPAYGKQAVYLDDANTVADLPGYAELASYKMQGIQIVAPPIFALLTTDAAGNIVPSQYARNAKTAGLDIITWSLERSGILADGNNGSYYQSVDPAIRREGDMMQVLDVLAKQVGVLGVFSDWPATTTFYANCAGIR
ncbi:glycerophosphodiester phosphodiesterase family protein [Ramlibacter tataouinensis]|uniref:glycerophosphodiester phosphodiesterase n=1 Tax=Ramlibacter tataouinensis (strain ATCC BAA-407 / DSM 14655 / LMG 21543 / TTB310) TaxID=365046 RepID=F5Y4Z4_RAMTT|nr:glycerophosphodiester phosphodiesterase family protein [Ramlibacter tataouinensis]AEG92650.1 glycerophosphoryl diester phosphodiesterase (Glycerophosphodiester phosphodiesterase)-like protein [Ramlibacter tataouinensis TTB310]